MSATAYRLAAQSVRDGAQWRLDDEARLARWDEALMNSGAAGEAVTGGLRRLQETRPVWAGTATQMGHAAGILDTASRLQSFLEERVAELKERIIAALPSPEDAPMSSWLIARLSELAGGLGDLIDAHCAAAISAVCTPHTLPPDRPLGLARAENIQAITESNLLAHPEYRELANAEGIAVLEAGPDGIAVCLGDLDSAEEVVTFVAGVGSSDQGRWPRQIENARAIHQATGAATIAWLGYRAPGDLTQALARQPARAAGANLRQFQHALAERNPQQRRVVIGYSYGSVVAAEAASSPLDADELVLVGSPGVPQGHAAQLQLSGSGGVHALTSPRDLIDWPADGRGGVHGIDPSAESFGAHRWPAGRGSHSSYFEDPEVLASLTGIVRGESPGAKPVSANRSLR